MRAEIAQWCDRIEILSRDMAVWFSKSIGLKVNLKGEPNITHHVREEPEPLDAKAAMEGSYADACGYDFIPLGLIPQACFGLDVGASVSE